MATEYLSGWHDIAAVADGCEAVLRVEITSDTPEKVHEARRKIAEVLTDGSYGDVMVTVHTHRDGGEHETPDR